MRGEMSASICPIGIGPPATLSEFGFVRAGASSSANEFQALHSGQRPIHFGDCAPHSLQEKTAVLRATGEL